MLGGLILENFKAFGLRQEIPLAPITLIFGANSAGKSSILQSLLLLKQTLAQAETSDAVLVPRGSWVDLGNFREFVFEHDTSRTMEITPILALPTSASLDTASGDPAPPRSTTRLGTGFYFRYDEEAKFVRVAGLPYYWGGSSNPAFRLRIFPMPPEISSGKREHLAFMADDDLAKEHPLWTVVHTKLMQGFGYVAKLV